MFSRGGTVIVNMVVSGGAGDMGLLLRNSLAGAQRNGVYYFQGVPRVSFNGPWVQVEVVTNISFSSVDAVVAMIRDRASLVGFSVGQTNSFYRQAAQASPVSGPGPVPAPAPYAPAPYAPSYVPAVLPPGWAKPQDNSTLLLVGGAALLIVLVLVMR